MFGKTIMGASTNQNAGNNYTQTTPLSKDDTKDFFTKFTESARKGAQNRADYIDDVANKNKLLSDYLKTVQGAEPVYQDYVEFCQDAQAANEDMSLSAKAASIGMNLLTASLNAVVVLVFAKVLEALFLAIDKSIHPLREAAKNAQASSDAYKAVCSEVSSLNQELSETNHQIDILSGKENPTLIEQEELQKLKSRNDELQRELKLKQNLAEIEKNNAEKSAKEYFSTTDISGYYDGSEHVSYERNQIEVASDYLKEYEALSSKISEYKKKIEAIKLANPKDYKSNFTYLHLSRYYKTLSQRSEKLEGKISDTTSQFMTYDDNLADPDLKKQLNEYYDDFDRAVNGAAQNTTKKLDNIFDRPTLRSTKDQLIALGKQGSLSVDLLKTNFSKLVSITDESEISIEDLYDYIMNLSDPDTISTDNVIKRLHSQFVDPSKDLGALDHKIAQDTFDRWISDKSESDIEILYQITADKNTSGWSMEDFDQELAERKSSELDITIEFSKKDMISKLNDMSDGFDALQKIRDSQTNSEPFDFSLLDDAKFKDTFKDLTEEYNDFIDIISNSPNDFSKCRSAYNNLLESWLKSEGILEHITEDNASVTEAMLTELGIANASELVSNSLMQKKVDLAAETNNLAALTDEEANALLNEATAAGASEAAFNAYRLQKALSQFAFDPSQDISNLKNLVAALNLGSSAWNNYYAAKERRDAIAASNMNIIIDDDGTVMGTKEEALDAMDTMLAAHQKQIENELDTLKTQYSAAPIAPSGGTSGSGSSSGSLQPKTYDWIQRKIGLLREEYSKFSKEIDDSNNSYRTQLNYLSEAEHNLREIISTEQQAEDIYFDNWERASAGLSDDIKSKIKNGSLSVEEYTSNSQAIDKAQDAWDQYKNQRQTRLEDEKELLSRQKSSYEKRLAWSQEEADRLAEKAGIEQTAYAEQQQYLDAAIAKEEQMLDMVREHAKEANAAWKEARDNVAAVDPKDVARIMAGTLDLSLFDEHSEYYSLLEKAIKALEDKKDADEELEDKEKSLEERRREAYEKATEYIEAQQNEFSQMNAVIQSEMDLINASGGLIAESSYREMIRNNDRLIDLYEEQLDLIHDRIDEVEDESTEYYDLMGQLQNVTQQINKARQEQAEWNYEIKMLPIKRIEAYLAILDAIKENLQGFIDWENTLGISTSKAELDQLFSLDSERIQKLQEQLQKYQEMLSGSGYEYGSEKYNEIVENINSVGSAITETVSEQQEWNRQLLNLPVDRMTKLNEELQTYQNMVQDQLDEQETALSAVSGLLEGEMDKLSKKQDEITEKYQEQIDPIEEQLEALEKQNEALSIQRNLEQALYDRERAGSQKTNKVIRNGEIIYEADIDALRSANQAAADAQYEKARYELEQSKEKLEELRDQEIKNLDAELERLDTIKAKWEEIGDTIRQAFQEQTASAVLGNGWQDQILSGSDQKLYDEFFKLHESTELQNDSLTKQIESNERIISQTQTIIDRFSAQELTLQEANDAISNIIALMKDGYTVEEQLSVQSALDHTNSIKEFSQQTNAQIAESVSTLHDYFITANDNNLKITEVMGTQTEKLEEIRRLDEENKRLYEEMLKKIEELNKYRQNKTYSFSDSSDRIDKTDHKSSGMTYDAESGHYYDQGHVGEADHLVDDPYDRFHAGIENGLVGRSRNTRADLLKRVATETLDPGERYIKVLEGEAVFTEEQQIQLLKNMNTPYFVPSVSPLSPALSAISPAKINQHIELHFGDLRLPNVTNADAFARSLAARFEPALRQELSKYR